MGTGAAAFVVGLIVGALFIWLLGPFGAVEPKVVTGQITAVSQDGAGISVAIEGQEQTEAYEIIGARWQRNGLPWQNSFPTCIAAGGTGQQVELGVVNVAATDTAPGGTVVVWVRCIGASE
jgi:hypothetical protein